MQTHYIEWKLAMGIRAKFADLVREQNLYCLVMFLFLRVYISSLS